MRLVWWGGASTFSVLSQSVYSWGVFQVGGLWFSVLISGSDHLSARCIGSIQHLKSKYGRGYSLEVKLREELMGLQQVALLHKEIRAIFPHAVRQERWGPHGAPFSRSRRWGGVYDEP